MSDKLSIINDCLSIKGQNNVAVADDGSEEWRVCSAAFDQGAKHLIEEHDWKFGTEIRSLVRAGDSPDEAYEDAYHRPTGCLHVVWVKINGVGQAYRIVGNKILLTAGSGTPDCKFVLAPDPSEWPGMFESAIKEWVHFGIESGLRKDTAAADGHLAKADEFLRRVRTRTDQQEPKRALFVTRHRAARQTRRG